MSEDRETCPKCKTYMVMPGYELCGPCTDAVAVERRVRAERVRRNVAKIVSEMIASQLAYSEYPALALSTLAEGLPEFVRLAKSAAEQIELACADDRTVWSAEREAL